MPYFTKLFCFWTKQALNNTGIKAPGSVKTPWKNAKGNNRVISRNGAVNWPSRLRVLTWKVRSIKTIDNEFLSLRNPMIGDGTTILANVRSSNGWSVLRYCFSYLNVVLQFFKSKQIFYLKDPLYIMFMVITVDLDFNYFF